MSGFLEGESIKEQEEEIGARDGLMKASPTQCAETGGETGVMAVKTRPDRRALGSDALSPPPVAIKPWENHFPSCLSVSSSVLQKLCFSTGRGSPMGIPTHQASYSINKVHVCSLIKNNGVNDNMPRIIISDL